MEMGRFDEAALCYERALAIEPCNATAFHELMHTRRITADYPYLGTLERLVVAASSLPIADQIKLHFAMGKACADLGQNERAFDHLLAGNALRRSQVDYAESEVLGLFERIQSVFSAQFIGARSGLGDPSERPVFILGMMRSGSTLVEQILASHPDVAAAGERRDLNLAYQTIRKPIPSSALYPEIVTSFTADQLRAIGTEYLRRLKDRTQTTMAMRITDKMPANFSSIGLIHLALPNARIIHTVRDPVATCLSCFSKLFAEDQPFTYDLGELGRYYRGYERLMDHWRAVLPEGSILDVRYDELVVDFATQVRRILDFCGLPWSDSCLTFHETVRPVRTASQRQIRQPIYQTSLSPWRPDDSKLRPLLKGLGTVMDAAATGTVNAGTHGSQTHKSVRDATDDSYLAGSG
jgi:tetratricopeptide (TPR) repeat protein